MGQRQSKKSSLQKKEILSKSFACIAKQQEWYNKRLDLNKIKIVQPGNVLIKRSVTVFYTSNRDKFPNIIFINKLKDLTVRIYKIFFRSIAMVIMVMILSDCRQSYYIARNTGAI